jgi:hypothetical protein
MLVGIGFSIDTENDVSMKKNKQHPWFGLDDVGAEMVSSMNFDDPKPLYNEKSQRDQDKALQNPEESIDKDPDKPWVQRNEQNPRETEIGVNEVQDWENGDPPIDSPAETGKRKKGKEN